MLCVTCFRKRGPSTLSAKTDRIEGGPVIRIPLSRTGHSYRLHLVRANVEDGKKVSYISHRISMFVIWIKD